MNANVRTLLVLLAACGLAAALRIGAWLPNVTAIGAVAIYAGSRWPWIGWLPPLAVMAVTDMALERMYGYPPFNRVVYACFIIEALVGALVIRKTTWQRVGVAGFLGALQFFLITNFFVWMKSADSGAVDYPKTFAGLMLCYTAALPFFGYTLLGNLGFGALIFGADAVLARATEPAVAGSEAR